MAEVEAIWAETPKQGPECKGLLGGDSRERERRMRQRQTGSQGRAH